jgi:hypothetical protein
MLLETIRVDLVRFVLFPWRGLRTLLLGQVPTALLKYVPAHPRSARQMAEPSFVLKGIPSGANSFPSNCSACVRGTVKSSTLHSLATSVTSKAVQKKRSAL